MHEVPAAPQPASATVAAQTDYPVRFLGTGSEYFRIWIVNLLLTIVTLGIYSAWAKVRRLKYMYRNTQIAGSSFDYHGSPIAILKGRLIALVLLLAYNFSFQFSLTAGAITLVLLAAVFPWLIRQSLRFRARYSSYRGIRFQFVGGLAEIYLIAAPLIVFIAPFALLGFYAENEGGPPVWLFAFLGLAMLTFFIVLPYLHYRFKRYQHGNAFLGSAAAHFTATAGNFYAVYAILLAVTLGIAAVFGAIGLAAGAGILGANGSASIFGAGLLMLIIGVYAVYFLLFAAFVVLIQNRIWNHTTVGEVSFRSNARVLPMARIYFVNILLLIVTLGLFTPFAVIRSLKYRLESVTAATAGDMDQFLSGAAADDVAATGEGAADLFDFDLGL
ncbi:MAG: YjgN family protein [Pseudomonadota bacterium]|nr:YjgN family protein [Pseudomonadota bacterium]